MVGRREDSEFDHNVNKSNEAKQMKRIRLILTALLLISPLAAQADLIEITGTGLYDGTWEIVLVEGTFTDLAATLTTQAWWNNAGLAGAFAGAFADAYGPSFDNYLLGFPLFLPPVLGPYFAYDEFSVPFFFWNLDLVNVSTTFFGNPHPSNWFTFQDHSGVYATATRVPEPATLAMLGIGLVGIGLARRRKKA